jgi:hypothetical protein
MKVFHHKVFLYASQWDYLRDNNETYHLREGYGISIEEVVPKYNRRNTRIKRVTLRIHTVKTMKEVLEVMRDRGIIAPRRRNLFTRVFQVLWFAFDK